MARRLPSIMCCNVSVEMWRMLSITLDTAPGEGGEAPVIKRPKSSEQQPATNPGQAQPAAFQHQHLLINCASFSYFAGVPKCPPFRVFTDSKFLGDGVMDRGAVGGGERTGG